MIDFLSMPDETLIEFVYAGNQSAFEVLLRRHHTRFYACAYRWVLHRQDAEDLVQEAFLKLWNQKARFDPKKKVRFTTWFYRIVYNQAIDLIRSKSRTTLELIEDLITYEATAEKDEMFKEEQTELRMALGELPDRQRMAVTLFFFEEMPQKNIAEIMGVSLKALESLLSRAKATLKERMVKHAA